MKNIEGSPFLGKFQGFSGNSYDSVVGLLQKKEGPENWRKHVLKWNRHDFVSPEDAVSAAKFRQKSIHLYEQTLGKEFIVPTHIVVGGKQNATGEKQKVYQVQPFVDGWTGKELPEDIREHPLIISQWQVLSERLFALYRLAQNVNSRVVVQFPITMTLGSSRSLSQICEVSNALPRTKNIIVRKQDLRLCLFDFGEYVAWQDEMDEAYEMILAKSKSLCSNGGQSNSGEIFISSQSKI